MENMKLDIAPMAQPSQRIAMPICATLATDLRTSDVRSLVCVKSVATVPATGAWAVRDRATAATTGMGHVGIFAGYVPGSTAWSPPI